MNLVERIKGILLQPKSEWPAIEGEPGDAGYLLSNYVAIVAAIPAVCTFIGTSLIGVGGFRLGLGLGIVRAIVVYVLSLVGVFVVAYIIDFLAGAFGARTRRHRRIRILSGCSSMVELQLPKLLTWVRFPSPAPS